MTYNKPEIAVLGETAQLIQGSRVASGETGDNLQQPSDCEFDD
jgi:hypothetical protein